MKFFTIAELCKSTTADRLGINNRCRQEHVTALTALVDNVLDPLRTWWGKPITVNSGYRCPELNAAVKESKTSQHMKGEAADIDTGDRQQNKLLFEYIRKNLPYDQLIDESNFAWVHVSYRADGNNRVDSYVDKKRPETKSQDCRKTQLLEDRFGRVPFFPACRRRRL